ncbi:hypothetical protein H8D79_01635 [PVC group bacterium]|nr:hypothetical protein [PVC group bacterium]
MPRKSSKMSIAALEKVLQETKSKVDALKQKRESLLKKVKDVEKQIAAMEGAPLGPQEAAAPKVARGGGRRNKVSLIQVCVDVLAKSGEVMTVGELAEGVAAAGYKSKSKDLKPLIYSQIYGESRIVRPERGKFQLKAGAVAAEEKPEAKAEDKPKRKAKK